MRYLPVFIDLIFIKLFNIGELTGDTKNTKLVMNGVIWGPPWSEFCMHLSTMSTMVFLSPKVFNLN